MVAADRRADVATGIEVQVVGVAAIRTTRPIAPEVTVIEEGPIAFVQITRGRIPDG